jgi:hypothetical protein
MLHRELAVLRPTLPDWYSEEIDATIPEHLRPRASGPKAARADLVHALQGFGFRHPAARF